MPMVHLNNNLDTLFYSDTDDAQGHCLQGSHGNKLISLIIITLKNAG